MSIFEAYHFWYLNLMTPAYIAIGAGIVFNLFISNVFCIIICAVFNKNQTFIDYSNQYKCTLIWASISQVIFSYRTFKTLYAGWGLKSNRHNIMALRKRTIEIPLIGYTNTALKRANIWFSFLSIFGDIGLLLVAVSVF